MKEVVHKILLICFNFQENSLRDHPFPSKHIYNFFASSCILLKGTLADWWTGPSPPFQRKILTIYKFGNFLSIRIGLSTSSMV
jgi:hypothetical protein